MDGSLEYTERRSNWFWLPLAGMLVAIVMERLALHFVRGSML